MPVRKRKPSPVELFRPTTSSVGCGPLTFDIEMARLHGWTEKEIAKCWVDLSRVYGKWTWRSTKRNPHLYHRCKDGTLMFIGPDKRGRSIDRKKLKDL